MHANRTATCSALQSVYHFLGCILFVAIQSWRILNASKSGWLLRSHLSSHYLHKLKMYVNQININFECESAAQLGRAWSQWPADFASIFFLPDVFAPRMILGRSRQQKPFCAKYFIEKVYQYMRQVPKTSLWWNPGGFRSCCVIIEWIYSVCNTYHSLDSYTVYCFHTRSTRSHAQKGTKPPKNIHSPLRLTMNENRQCSLHFKAQIYSDIVFLPHAMQKVPTVTSRQQKSLTR